MYPPGIAMVLMGDHDRCRRNSPARSTVPRELRCARRPCLGAAAIPPKRLPHGRVDGGFSVEVLQAGCKSRVSAGWSRASRRQLSGSPPRMLAGLFASALRLRRSAYGSSAVAFGDVPGARLLIPQQLPDGALPRAMPFECARGSCLGVSVRNLREVEHHAGIVAVEHGLEPPDGIPKGSNLGEVAVEIGGQARLGFRQ